MLFNRDNWKRNWDRARECVLNATVVQQADQEKNLRIVTGK